MSPEEEKEKVAAMEATLPRPSWYSTDSDDGEEELVDAAEINEMKVKPPGSTGILIVYIILIGIGWVFNLASSCPIPWMKAKHGGRTYGVWRAKGAGLPDLKVNNIHDCSNEMQYWQAGAAFSVFATCFSFGALISGILLICGKGHIGVSIGLAFYSMSFSLVSWSLIAALLHYHRCGKGTYNSFARLDAGFALTVVAWVLELVACLLLLIYFSCRYTKSVHSAKYSPMRIVYVILIFIVIVFWCVGCAYTMYEKDFPLVKSKITIWHTEVYDKASKMSTFLGRKWYMCSTYTRRMKVVAAFNIMSNIWAFFALMCGFASIQNRKMISKASLFGFIAFFFSFVSWLVIVINKSRILCNTEILEGQSLWYDLGYNGIPTGVEDGLINVKNYKLGEGFILIVTGWALVLVASILNCIFK
ncbi:hypothetical protein AGDE_02556 [Angomonas deanei]|uniref:Amastin surface glycoprotein, putative n=1 Tax=Angomonas deanei TaxID=59799 RepID=A0A7G2CSZ8_9TRYP|nr:hypothetical protein AGDE_02556 [Angomonas deanei]CAD2222918.1 Amastin surface glycoprotein, putative [Angomonas deanei]|eukprot:EPY41368.1 hypothetical protein AGDE_02556 [Angomonas deanei]